MVFQVKRLCCAFLWLLLLAPALQAKFKWVKEDDLHGAYEVAPRATFSFDGLFGNTFQPQLEHYLEDRIGFRNTFIKLRNQLAYSVFNESWANRLAVGRHGILFEQEYIDAYLGHNYVGQDVVQLNARRLRNVQDSLAHHGVQLVFVIAPSKATFMPENLPARARQQARTRTNYEAYTQALAAAGVHVLDFNQAFHRWKPTAPHLLFASGGVHWSMYGGARAADSLQHYLRDSLHISTTPFKLSEPELSTVPRYTDDDLTKTMNLKNNPFKEELAYPTLVPLPVPAGQPKPNMLLIADSFGWTWLYNSFINKFSDQSRYWYYNTRVDWPGEELTPEGRDADKLKTREQYLARNLIVVMFNEMGLAQFDRGFNREVFNLFHPYVQADHDRYGELTKQMQDQANWEELASPDFIQHMNTTVNAIIDQERLARVLNSKK